MGTLQVNPRVWAVWPPATTLTPQLARLIQGHEELFCEFVSQLKLPGDALGDRTSYVFLRFSEAVAQEAGAQAAVPDVPGVLAASADGQAWSPVWGRIAAALAQINPTGRSRSPPPVVVVPAVPGELAGCSAGLVWHVWLEA